MKTTINSTLIKDLPAGPVDIRDDRLPGFVLRVSKAGRGMYRVQYARGKWVTLGKMEHLKPAEAREQARVILGEAAKGHDPSAARKRERAATFRQYLANVYAPWLETHRKDGKATAARLRACFGDDLGTCRLPDVTPWLVEKWRSRRLKAGRKPSTVNRDLNALKAAMNRAVEWGYLDANPIAGVKPAKTDGKGVVRYLSANEAERLREALREREDRMREERARANQWRRERNYPTFPEMDAPFVDYLRPLVLLALNTGMRRGELFGLEWRDIDHDRRTLTVRGEGSKSGQTRHLPLSPEAVEVLAGWRQSTEGTGLVFPGPDGARRTIVKTAWGRVLEAAGIEGFRFHDLRHTFASWLVMGGTDLYTVRDLLGHSSVAMTERYAHLAPEHKAAAVATLRPPETTARPDRQRGGA